MIYSKIVSCYGRYCINECTDSETGLISYRLFDREHVNPIKAYNTFDEAHNGIISKILIDWSYLETHPLSFIDKIEDPELKEFSNTVDSKLYFVWAISNIIWLRDTKGRNAALKFIERIEGLTTT